MHTVWKGSLSLGLLNIGIRLFSAVEEKDIKFLSLHKECLTPIKYKKIAPDCTDTEVSDEDVVKAYEYAPHKYIIVEDKELDTLQKKHEPRLIRLSSFIQNDEIDSIFFDRSYFMGPTVGNEKTYLLLKEALDRTNKLGLIHITIRKKQHLAIIRSFQEGLILQTIHYPDEIRNIKNMPGLPKNEEYPIHKQELTTAMNLIHHLTTPFEPEEYIDEYKEVFTDFIEEKIEQQEKNEIIYPNTNIINIIETLNASIEQVKQQKDKKKEEINEQKAT
ncbi:MULTISPECIES: non-homologous end joining protein Ku [Bacillus]|uniref:non-homologous end joining protein Ku n=1 Tax=Bacillus TaxID=1386 RepID=UPI000DC4E980|nr:MULTISPECIES: Ku protein [Bacillus]RAN68254.1 Ku protein [Bacillus sp. SRB_8]TKI39585.1 Ku protein [Bacillus mycoides]WJE67494.1 Ku protein [Bacillus mycoides]